MSKIAIALAVAVLAAGCASGGEAASPMAEQIESLLERVGDDMPPSQQVVLEDLEITYDEYERANLLTIECLRDSGVDVRGPEVINNGRYLGYSFASPNADADAECRREHISYVEQIWVEAQVPTGAEEEQQRSLYEGCLVAAGMAPPQDVTFADLERFVAESLRAPGPWDDSAVDSCIRQYSRAIWSSDG